VKRAVAVALLAGLLAAACGGDDTGATDPAATTPTAVEDPAAPDDGDAGDTVLGPIGPTMPVADLLAAGDGGPFSVQGFLFVLADGTIVLADAIAESYPPQPAGAQVIVEGINLQTVPLVEGPTDSEIAIVAWTELPIEVIGSVDGGVLVGSTPASG
jgi:hypothetical protein